jgi:hypothetical protein
MVNPKIRCPILRLISLYNKFHSGKKFDGDVSKAS